MIEIELVSFNSSVVGRRGLGADQGVGPALAFGTVGGVEFPCIDDLLQMLPPFLGQGET